jgi:acyl-CoA thioesterase-1
MGTRFWRFSTLIIRTILKVTRLLTLSYFCIGVAASHAAPQKLLVLGDSISAAYGMSLEQGWVALLARHLATSHPDLSIVNASVSGETTSGALLRLPSLLAETKPTIVLVELGGNDGLRGYPTGLLRDNLKQLVTASQASGAQVIVVQMEIPPNYGARYTGAFRASYALIAEQTNSVLAPFMLDGVATHSDLMQPDGIHPTVAAQQQLLDNILPTILAVLKSL